MPRLEVPLDYSKPKGDIFKIAVLKLPAISYSGTKKAFIINTDFQNAVDFSLAIAPFYQLGGFNDFDFHAFETRGSGYSTPQLACFPDLNSQYDYAIRSANPDNVFGSFNGSFPPTDANIKANIKKSSDFMSEFGKNCKE
jgi:hypothetical protein